MRSRIVPGTQRAQGSQALDRGAGPQDAAHDLRHASQKHAPRGQNHGLGGIDDRSKCAPMIAYAGQTRIRSSARLT